MSYTGLHQYKNNGGQPTGTSGRSQLFTLLVLLLVLMGCSDVVEPTGPAEVAGSESPEAAVQGFFLQTNAALRDPALSQPGVRRSWSARLASFFAPSERIEQRQVLGQMLADFATGLETLAPNEEITIEIGYDNVQVVQQDATHASVRLQDATFTYRVVEVAESGFRNVLYSQQRPLHEVLGVEESSGFQVLQVNGRWFITDR